MRKAIITSRTLTNRWGEDFASVSQSLVQYLLWAGYYSVLLSKQSASQLPEFIDSFQPDLVVLSGGESVGEDLGRDSFEFGLLNTIQKTDTPTLGICRGMQIIGSFFGQDPIPVENHAGTRHSIGGFMSAEVNSFHNFGFKQVVTPLVPLIRAQDGTIEAFSHSHLPWLGVMWHPERDIPEDWYNVLKFIL
jgi:putative glutamine amidotransferase